MEEPGAYKPFQIVEDDHRTQYNAIERGLEVLMSDYQTLLFEVREDHDLLTRPDVDVESASQIEALRLPDDWAGSGEIRIAEIQMDES